MNLYRLSTEYAIALDKLMDSDLPADCIADTIEGMGGEVTERARNVVAYALNLEAEAVMIREAEKKMAARRQAIERHAANFRNYLKTAMELTGITEIKANDGSFVAKLWLDRDEAVIIDDELLLEPEYIVVTTTTAPNKAAIKLAINEGRVVAGSRIEKRNRLEIK